MYKKCLQQQRADVAYIVDHCRAIIARAISMLYCEQHSYRRRTQHFLQWSAWTGRRATGSRREAGETARNSAASTRIWIIILIIRGATCRNSGPKECLDGGWEILYLRVVRSSWFFQTMLTIQYTSRLFKKIPTFSIFRSPIDVDNRNLVVPYKQVRHPSQFNILYMFYA